MNLGWKHLAGQLMHGTDLQKASAEEIDILLEEYPYFAGLHILKVAKLRQLGSEDLPAAVSRAALYFPNPHWFRLGMEKLHHDLGAGETTVHAPAQDALAESSLESAFTAMPAEPEAVTAQPELVEPVEDVLPEPVEPTTSWEHHLAENPVFQQHVVSDEEHYEQEVWHRQDNTVEEEATLAEATEPQQPSDLTAQTETTVEITAELPETPTYEDEPVILHDAPVEDTGLQNLPMEEPAPEMSVAETLEQAAPVTEIPDQEKAISAVEETSSQPGPGPVAAGPALDIPFEPLYTIDYFASQGIKVNQDAPTKDQLALKLRSFTEWLRAMKKIHPEKMAKDFNQDEEDHVRVNAEVSNEAHEVYTEAMAEVFLKQGKKDKAREVFEKLSLLDPSKSAYFAVRIKEIN